MLLVRTRPSLWVRGGMRPRAAHVRALRAFRSEHERAPLRATRARHARARRLARGLPYLTDPGLARIPRPRTRGSRARREAPRP